MEQLEEAKDHLWKIKGDKDFEKKSEDFVNKTIAGLQKEVGQEKVGFGNPEF